MLRGGPRLRVSCAAPSRCEVQAASRSAAEVVPAAPCRSSRHAEGLVNPVKSLRWIVPLQPGQLTADSPQLVASITADLEIEVHGLGREGRPLLRLSGLASCQLGQALLDASRVSGQLWEKRGGR